MENPVIGELASLHTLEYELQRDTAAAGLGIRVSALDKLVKGRRAATEDENTALPHWNVEPSAEPVDGAVLLNNLRQVFRRYVVLPKGADIVRNPAQRGHRFQRKADSIPVIADSR
jgi:hypothetical protein